MRKNNLLPLILLCTFLAVNGIAQAQVKSLADEAAKYGEGGRYEEEVERSGYVVDEYYDANGTLREEVLYGVKVDGQSLPGIQRNYYDCEGKFIYKSIKVSLKGGLNVTDANAKPTETIYYEERVEYKDNKIVKGQKKYSTDRWDFYEEYDTREAPGSSSAQGWTKTVYVPGPKEFFQLGEPEPTSPDECDGDCDDPVSELFGGYSFLAALSDGETESFPLGAHLAYTYMLTKQFGLVADASFHTKKENEFRIMRAFLMGGLQYHIMREREKRFVLPMLRLLAGAAFDKQKYPGSSSNATGLVIAAGFGFQFPLNQFIAATLLTDYLRVKFKDQDALGHVRVSAGVKFVLNCTYKKK